jgi:hypothetical protein
VSEQAHGDHLRLISIVHTPSSARQQYSPLFDLRGGDGTVTTDIGSTGQRCTKRQS